MIGLASNSAPDNGTGNQLESPPQIKDGMNSAAIRLWTFNRVYMLATCTTFLRLVRTVAKK